jgi:AcrR family transcriptional regulator
MVQPCTSASGAAVSTSVQDSAAHSARRDTVDAPSSHRRNSGSLDTRTTILEAAAAMLHASTSRDISTRAVSEAVGIGVPVLYRLFGDKNGLLTAIVEHAFQNYLSETRAHPPSADPVDDLYIAWDRHVQFALDNPTVYRIAYAPALEYVSTGVGTARELLSESFDRCARAGQLITTPDEATQVMTAACVGVCICLLSLPDTFNDPGLSWRVRDAVLRGLLVQRVAAAPTNPMRMLRNVALQLAALVRVSSTSLTGAEAGLLLQWLDTIGAIADPDVVTASERAGVEYPHINRIGTGLSS